MNYCGTYSSQPLYTSILGWSCVPLPLATTDSTQGITSMSADGLDTDFIPGSLRRRCSILSKVTLAVAHAAARGRADLTSLPSVFSSAHGESDITATLLQDLAIPQPLSPMGFSLSVHNAASGLFSIATGNTAASTAIAANSHSLIMGVCEALLRIQTGPKTSVLYVCSDDRVPSVFLSSSATEEAPFALAVLFGPQDSVGGAPVQITVQQNSDLRSDYPRSAESGEAASAFIAWLNDQTPSVELQACGSVWRFEAEQSRATLFTSPYRV
jgi:hypothetical protein